MKNLHQVNLVKKHLNFGKEKYLIDLGKINDLLHKKKVSYERMVDYLNDYLNPENLKMSRDMPVLNKNIHLFVNKINTVLAQTQIEIEMLQSSQSSLLNKISEIDQKIDAMEIFEDTVKKEMRAQQDKKEQNLLDDMVSVLDLRREHE